MRALVLTLGLVCACTAGGPQSPLVDTLLRAEASDHLQCEGATLSVGDGGPVADVQGNFANYMVSGCNKQEKFTCGQFCGADAISCMPADMVILFHCPER